MWSRTPDTQNPLWINISIKQSKQEVTVSGSLTTLVGLSDWWITLVAKTLVKRTIVDKTKHNCGKGSYEIHYSF